MTFKDPADADRAVADDHVVDGREVRETDTLTHASQKKGKSMGEDGNERERPRAGQGIHGSVQTHDSVQILLDFGSILFKMPQIFLKA